jgi:hypothetical protein
MEITDRFGLPITSASAQALVFEDSLILGYLPSGQPAKAEPLLRSRLSRRPSARDEAWLAQCQ